MSISMNNHETRIKALENKGSGSWTKGTKNSGYWAKESSTGLIIQWRLANGIGWDASTTVTLPRSFSDTNYAVVCTTDGAWETTAWANGLQVKRNSASEFGVHGSGDQRSFSWIAIGYLITNRLLNYIREVILWASL